MGTACDLWLRARKHVCSDSGPRRMIPGLPKPQGQHPMRTGARRRCPSDEPQEGTSSGFPARGDRYAPPGPPGPASCCLSPLGRGGLSQWQQSHWTGDHPGLPIGRPPPTCSLLFSHHIPPSHAQPQPCLTLPLPPSSSLAPRPPARHCCLVFIWGSQEGSGTDGVSLSGPVWSALRVVSTP